MSVLVHRRWHDEIAITRLGGGGEHLVPIERWPYRVVTKRVRHLQGMRGGFHPVGVEGLDSGGMFEDDAQLFPIGVQLVWTEVQPGEAGDMGDVDVDRHGSGSVGEGPGRPIRPYRRHMRRLLAVTTLAVLGGASFAAFGDDTALAGMLFRVGVVLGAIWLAWPSLERIDRRTVWVLAVGGLVILLRPRAALAIVVVMAVFLRTTKVRRPPADQ